MNFFEELEPSFSNNINNNNPLFEENENILFPFPLDESTIPVIKNENNSFNNKNIFITKKTMKEKIKHQKFILEQKKVLTNKEKKEIYFNKKEDLKKRNRESAQRSRDKKKLVFQQIIEENKKLKDELYIINTKINLLCSGCKSIFDLKTEETKDKNICINCYSINDNNNNKENNNNDNDNSDINDNLLNIPSTNTSFINLKIQKLFNFILIGLFTLLCFFGIFSSLPSNINYNNNQIEQKLRNNLEKEQNINNTINDINIVNNYNNHNISRINDYFFKRNNYIESNINNNIINKINFNNNNVHKNEICEKDYFTSFQCHKKSFHDFYNRDIEQNIYNENNINNEDNKNNLSQNQNKTKNSLYFKLFVQSCSKDEGYTNQNLNNDENNVSTTTHYIFSSDNNIYQDFYYYCKRSEN